MKPYWQETFENLRKDSKYNEAIQLIESIYPHNLRWIINQYTNINVCHLSSRELQIYFLESVFLNLCSLKDLRDYCKYFQENIFGNYGIDEAVKLENLRVNDTVRHLGKKWQVISVNPVLITTGYELSDLNCKIIYRIRN